MSPLSETTSFPHPMCRALVPFALAHFLSRSTHGQLLLLPLLRQMVNKLPRLLTYVLVVINGQIGCLKSATSAMVVPFQRLSPPPAQLFHNP
eukprot:m.76638 g.76638  ORF g.76638 m.76638 type:complete len:92 (+) comp7883_c0_seq2:283-558(+)